MRAKHGLALVRIAACLGMLMHGLPKLVELVSPGDVLFPDPLGLGARTSLAFAVGAEVGCAAFCLLGLWTRAMALPIVFTMGVAAFLVHKDDGFAQQELALVYGVLFLALVLGGPGAPSIDLAMRRRRLERV